MKKKFFILFILLLLLLTSCREQETYISRRKRIFWNDEDTWSDKSAWNDKQASEGVFELILVNRNNYVPKGIEHDFVELKNGVIVDSRIYPDLQNMFDDMRSIGLDPIVTWGFRSNETQKALFDDGYQRRLNQGMNKNDAYEDTAKSIAIPGTSEHELGLAIDVKSLSGYNEPLYAWLEKNSYRYGFILRYPYGMTEITGVKFEPWHFRYVGHQHAKEIYQSGLTLEEYLENIKQ